MQTPSVSVVIPVYNDPEGVRLTLESVSNQTYPNKDYEVVVVNNNSDDGDDTQGAIDEYHEQYPERVRPVFESEQGRWHALDAGIEAARGDVLAFVDAEMTVEVDWLASVIEALEETGADYLGTTVESYPPDGKETTATLFDRLTLFRMGEYFEESYFVGAGCTTVRREVIDAVGGFSTDVRYMADNEFGKRIHAAGFSQHFEPSIVMRHPARASVGAHWKKNVKVGRGSRELARAYPEYFDASSPFRLRGFLPPHPGRFVDRLRERMAERDIDSGDRSLREWAGLYSLGCVQKYARTAGSLYEYLTGE